MGKALRYRPKLWREVALTLMGQGLPGVEIPPLAAGHKRSEASRGRAPLSSVAPDAVCSGAV